MPPRNGRLRCVGPDPDGPLARHYAKLHSQEKAMSIPTIGRTVHVCGVLSNGSNVHPGIITRVWGAGDTDHTPVRINVTVFPDCLAPQVHSSVPLYADDLQAMSAGCVAAYWPPAAPARP